MPLLMAKRALRDVPSGGILLVLSTDAGSERDFREFRTIGGAHRALRAFRGRIAADDYQTRHTRSAGYVKVLTKWYRRYLSEGGGGVTGASGCCLWRDARVRGNPGASLCSRHSRLSHAGRGQCHASSGASGGDQCGHFYAALFGGFVAVLFGLAPLVWRQSWWRQGARHRP